VCAHAPSKRTYFFFFLNSTSSCPLRAANSHVLSFHTHPFWYIRFKTSRCPPRAALEHVSLSHGHLSSRNAFKSSSSPYNALQKCSLRSSPPRECLYFNVLTYPSSAASQPINLHTLRPDASTASRIPRVTAQSCERCRVKQCAENVLDNDVFWKARKGLLRVGFVPLSRYRLLWEYMSKAG